MTEKKRELDNLTNVLADPNTAGDSLAKTAAQFIDTAADLNDLEALNFGIGILEKRKGTLSTSENVCLVHYYISIAYGKVIEKTISKTEKDWDWEQELIEKELLNLRIAFQNITAQVDRQIAAFILINLANRLDNLGRFLLSLDFWNKASEYFQNLGMAPVNIGNSLMYYGRNYINDPKYQVAFIQLAHQLFKIGLKKPLFPGVADKVQERLTALEKNYRQALDHRLVRSDLIEDHQEVDYSNWCTENGVWLNPLSNLNPKLLCNKDDIQLFHADKEIVDFFNSTIEDFKYCRKIFFTSLTDSEEFSIQRKKTTFKEAYSIFDKTAYLISGILNLDEKNSHRLSFSRMWYVKLEKNKGLSDTFTKSRNLMFRALYWVSKDIYLNEEGFKNMIEPKAKEVNTIRNFVEHRSFKFGAQREQNFSLTIPEAEFDENLMKLLKLVRETLIYTAYLTKPDQK